MADPDELYHHERVFIARCGDVRALLDRMAEYRDTQSTAAARGLVEWRLRMNDLLELAEARVVALKVAAMPRREHLDADDDELDRRRDVRPNPASVAVPVQHRPAPQARVEAPVPQRVWSAPTRPIASTPPRPAPGPAPAPVRPAHAPQSEVRRTQNPPPRMPTRPAPALSPPLRAGLRPTPSSAATRVFTGSDLARLRAARGLTQRAAAELLGVAHGTVAKGELLGDGALGEALQTAMRRVTKG